MRAVIVAVVLGGCFSPQPSAGVPCADPSAPSRCPSGLVCVSNGAIETCERPGGPTDDGGPLDDSAPADAPIDQAPIIDACPSCLDTDTDGVADMNDNCPMVKNSDQSNEDGDSHGDPCDPCPINANNADDDGDGVGNFCDPSGTTADTIAQFVSFATTTLPAGWATEGTVTIAGGEATFDAPAGTGAYLTFASPAGSMSIWTNVTFDAYDGAVLAGMGVMDRRQAGTDMTLACQLVGNSAQTTHDIRLFDTTGPGLVASLDHPMDVGTNSTIRLTREFGTPYRCSASMPFAEVQGTTAFDPLTEHIGLRIRSGVAKAKWVMVLTH